MSTTPLSVLSVWERESFFAPADIVIAGSGLVGLWSAYYLKKSAPHLSVTIVDRGIIPTGASTRNAGFACFGSLTELVADSRKMGEKAEWLRLDTRSLEIIPQCERHRLFQSHSKRLN